MTIKVPAVWTPEVSGTVTTTNSGVVRKTQAGVVRKEQDGTTSRTLQPNVIAVQAPTAWSGGE